MKKLLYALSAAAALAACSSTPVPVLRAEKPAIYLQSSRSADTLASCLAGRLSNVRMTSHGDSAELLVGGQAWLIDVSEYRGRSVLSAHRGDDGESVEPEVRFAIARCAL